MPTDSQRLPVDVERGARGGPNFSTSITSTINGAETRNSQWADSRATYDIGYGIRSRADLEAVLSFFYGRRGRARSFLFKDWLDYKTEAVTVAAGPTALTRQLVKRYDTGGNEYVRFITQPIVSTLLVYVDNVATTSYTYDGAGIISFASDPGVNVKAAFEFDVPARFNVDSLSVALEHFNAGSIASIPIIEVRE